MFDMCWASGRVLSPNARLELRMQRGQASAAQRVDRKYERWTAQHDMLGITPILKELRVKLAPLFCITL